MNYLNSKYFGLLSTIFICICPLISSAQDILISGQILDEHAIGVTNCTVKIYNPSSQIVYSFFNTGAQNTFSRRLDVQADTILVVISHIGYQDTTVRYVSASGRSFFFEIKLQLRADVMDSLIVKPPPKWKRGDTTFFKVDGFKNGNETRLKELLVSLPDFEISDDGRLFYKKKAISKIMINGQEIFGDKIKLLLNNFPMHVLNTIQAIENQNDDKLLQGLGQDNSTVLNLGLTGKATLVPFGSAEVGAGTSGKYMVNPVFFGLSGKIKMGFIGDWNNTGNAVGWREESELQDHAEIVAKTWMMNNIHLQLIPDFEGRWYIGNNKKDMRWQLNIPVNARLTSKTEVSLLKDDQNQLSFYQESLYANNGFQVRNDSSSYRNRPTYLTINQTFDYKVDAASSIKASIHFYDDLTDGQSSTGFSIGNSRSTLQQSISNKWHSLVARLEYTHRVSPKIANKSITEFNFQRQNQGGSGISAQWPAIFQLDSTFNFLSTAITNRVYEIKQYLLQDRRLRNGTIEYGLAYDNKQIRFDDSLYLSNVHPSSQKVFPRNLSNNAKYIQNRLHLNLRRTIQFGKMASLSSYVDAGFSTINGKENTDSYIYHYPDIYASIEYEKRFENSFNFNFSGIYQQLPVNDDQLYGFLKPITINAFAQYVNLSSPLRLVDLKYSLGWKWFRTFSSSNLSFDYRTNLTGFVSYNALDNFVETLKDSLIGRPTESFSVATVQEIPSVFLMGVFRINASYTRNFNFMASNSDLVKVSNSVMECKVSFKKKLNKLYVVNIDANGLLNEYYYPKALAVGLAQKVLNFKTTLKQLFIFSPQMSVTVNGTVFSYNLFQPAVHTFFFADIGGHYKMKKMPVSFSCQAENLANLQYYYGNVSMPTRQAFYRLPLIKRRVFFSVRYEF